MPKGLCSFDKMSINGGRERPTQLLYAILPVSLMPGSFLFPVHTWSWIPPRKGHRSAWACVGDRKARAIIFLWKSRWSCWPVLCVGGTVNFTVSAAAARLCLRVWFGRCQNFRCTNAPDGAHECSCSFLLMKCLWRPNMNSLIHDDWCHKLIFLLATRTKWQTFSLHSEWQELKWLSVFSLR